MKEIKDFDELVEWVEDMYTQNLNGRETEIELYEQGMRDMLTELIDECGIVKFPIITK